MLANTIKKFYPVIFITLVVLVTTSLLALTESVTWERLKAQQDQQTLDMLKGIFQEASFYILEDDIYTIYNNNRDEIGFAFYAKGKGFMGEIRILVGLEDKETIKGIYVISHNDTLGGWGESEMGPRLEFSPWDEQFEGLKIENCYLASPINKAGQVDAITSATISCEAVTDIVRTSALEKVQYLD